MNFEPVKLPKETIAAIEKMRNKRDCTDAHIVAMVIQADNSNEGESGPIIRGLMKVDVNTLMQALVVGWTPALTLEEELAERFKPYFEGGDAEVVAGCAITLEVIAKHNPNYAHLDKWANKDQFRLVAKKEDVM